MSASPRTSTIRPPGRLLRPAFSALAASGLTAGDGAEAALAAANPWLPGIVAMLLIGIGALFLLTRINRRQQRTLSETKTHYQNLLDAVDGYIAFRAVVTPANGLRFELASRSLELMLGHPLAWYQASDQRFLEQVHADDRMALQSLLDQVGRQQLKTVRLRLRIECPGVPAQRVLMLHANSMPTPGGVALDGVLIDFTKESQAESQREVLQQQLQNAQRNESLGLLASGVAHDFNNILSAIRGNAELLTGHIPEAHRHRLDRLFQAVDRASGLVRQILAYSGRGRVESRPLDLGDELRQLDALIRHALPRSVETVLHIEPYLPSVMFDPAQFQQVAVNLLVNAAESYDGGPGEVQAILDRHQDRIRLRIIDHGCGMDQATMARIFDPYFTTKDHGHGLGLAAVQGIVAGVSGTITCESVVGKGTTFTVLLTPCLSGTLRKINSPLPEVADGAQYALVVDDDELVREITVETLTGLGYTCLQAAGGKSCLHQLQEAGQPIALLVLDCRMPDIDGVTVLKRIREQGNRLPVVLISGMINVDSVSPLLRDRRTRFLAKPFSQNQMSAVLSSLFGSQTYRRSDDSSSRTAFMVADVIRQRNEEHNRRDGSSQYRRKK